jgi:hypothetical protein
MTNIIDLGVDYLEHLRNTRPIIAYTKKSQKIIIPPHNSNIFFTSKVKHFDISDYPEIAALESKTLPIHFNWKDNGGDKSALIADPPNQYLCGSCWAVSTALTIADKHVVSGIVDTKPNLSATWALTLSGEEEGQMKCIGGNAAQLLKDIETRGIATEHCIDYSWCATNYQCNGLPENHMNKEVQHTDLSSLVPSHGCYDNTNKHYLYYIHNISVASFNDSHENYDSAKNFDAFMHKIKRHILHHGPVQGGFFVFNNFMSGDFTNTKGVYLENYDYNNTRNGFVNHAVSNNIYKSQFPYVGAHSVSIIGWGIEKNVVIDNHGNTDDVPYWYCRNSWSSNWGDNGYFKIATSKHNKISQFDKIVHIVTPNNQTLEAGGILLFMAGKDKNIKGDNPELTHLQQIDDDNNIKRLHPSSFYREEKNPRQNKKIENIKHTKNKQTNQEHYSLTNTNTNTNTNNKSKIPMYVWIIIGVIILFFVIILIIFFLKYYNKSSHLVKISRF